jgi:2-polyprenyl-3-methyl-5-hydroxy-6-metoxy-1,4-benzoquinol methylase
MTVLLDPDNLEIQALSRLVDFSGKKILEIGCGDGRLTWHIAPLAHRVIAIDPKPERIEQARQAQPDTLQEKLSFLALGIEEFYHSQANHEKFDLALLSWSL